jgi:hypothetical protein
VIESIGVPYGSRTRVAAVKGKRPVVIQENLAARIAHFTAVQGLTGIVIGPLMDARKIIFSPQHRIEKHKANIGPL